LAPKDPARDFISPAPALDATRLTSQVLEPGPPVDQFSPEWSRWDAGFSELGPFVRNGRPPSRVSTILSGMVGHMTVKTEGAGSSLVSDNFSNLNLSCPQLWALWVPEEESRGRSGIGEESQEGHPIKSISLPLPACQSNQTKSGCKRYTRISVKNKPPFLKSDPSGYEMVDCTISAESGLQDVNSP
jgi:hypothetical protein